jgi:SpoVK/Ycf46/Vps4 family AAA+-type ATPase
MNPLLSHTEMRDIADLCVGFVPADLAAVVRKVQLFNIIEEQDAPSNESMNGTSNAQNNIDLWTRAIAEVGASALRDAALTAPPTTTWDDIAGDPGGAKTALRQAMEWPRTKRTAYEGLGLTPPRGILLHGPPGCAKTTLARAAADATAVSFLSLSPADVYSTSYVGDAEAVIRRAFTLARSASPCVLFFDEIDAILGMDENHSNHQSGMGRGSAVEARVLSTFLNEMDGVDGSWKDGVLVLGATNRPWTLDTALLRPGRFDKVIYVPPPDFQGRREIISMHCQHWSKYTIERSKLDVDSFAADALSGNMTGAEIVGACREAAMLCLRQAMATTTTTDDSDPSTAPTIRLLMKPEYLEIALKNVRPLLSNKSILEDFESFQLERTRHVGS